MPLELQRAVALGAKRLGVSDAGFVELAVREHLPQLEREVKRLRLVRLTRNQSTLFNRVDQRPTVKTFAPIASREQLLELRSATVIRVDRSDYGRDEGIFTLIALVRPTPAERARYKITAQRIATQRQIVERAIAALARSSAKRQSTLLYIEKHGSDAQKAAVAEFLDVITQ